MMIPLIHALYDPQAPFPTHMKCFIEELADIEFFGIAPQVYFLLKQHDLLERTPPFFRNRLKALHHESLTRSMYIQLETNQILNRFEQAGIAVMPLKGTFFAEKYFGHIGARATSDIDLFIQASELERAKSCIQSLGFTVEGKRIASHFHISLAKPLPHSPLPLPVELHWSLLTEKTSTFNVDELWEQAKPYKSYKHVMELSDYHTFYMICLHGWRHALDSPRYFLDIAQMIHRASQNLDYHQLFEDALIHRTAKRMASTLSIVYQQFPHLHHILPFPYQRKSRLWWNYNSIRNKQGRSLMQYVRFAQYQWLDYDTAMHSLAATFQYFRSLRKG